MTAKIIDGKKLAAELKTVIAKDVQRAVLKKQRVPGLAVILVGEDAASVVYIKNKQQACVEVGFKSTLYALPDTLIEADLLQLIHDLNTDDSVDGILIQLPLPAHINTATVLTSISPDKDVDGFHPFNFGSLAQRNPRFRPCTPRGVMLILDQLKVNYQKTYAVVVGASNIVGRPMALELLMAGCTVTICHRLTPNLKDFVGQADLLVTAVGKPNLILGEWLRPNAIVIDIGISRLPDGRLVGDIEFAGAKAKASWLTPVPGGVGPMTVATLLLNTWEAYSKKFPN